MAVRVDFARVCLSLYTLLQALVGAAQAEKSTTVQRSYAQAAATVAKHTSEARLAKLVQEAVALYTNPGVCPQPLAYKSDNKVIQSHLNSWLQCLEDDKSNEKSSRP